MKPSVAVIHTQADFEGSDVPLGAADVALRGEVGVCAAIEHSTYRLASRRKPDVQLVAQANGIDVGLLDVSTHPEIVGIDQSDDWLTEIHHLRSEEHTS